MPETVLISTPFRSAMVAKVAQIVESDLRDASPFEDAPEHIVDAVRRDGANLGQGEYVLVMCLGFLLFQDFYRLR